MKVVMLVRAYYTHFMNPFDRSALSADNEDIKVRYCRVGIGAARFCASATISV